MSNIALPGQVEVVFPGSPLTQVMDTTQGINKYICRIDIELAHNQRAHGTGVLIGHRHVLTAAHNVANSTFGNAIRVTVVPGQNGDQMPYGSFESRRWFVSEYYTASEPPYPSSDGTMDYTRYLYDYAIIVLDQSALPGAMLFPQPYVASAAQIRQGNAVIKGYPGNQPAGTMWEATGPIQLQDDDDPFLFYKISTYGGDSGAGVLKSLDGSTYITGVHIAGSGPDGLNSNFAVRINEDVYAQIRLWLNS